MEVHQSVQHSLDRISTFLKNRRLDLSPEKSQWIVFSRSKKLPFLLPLKIFGISIPIVNSVKFLGIFLDSGMIDKEHLKYLVRRGSVIVDILSSLAGTWWGSHPYFLLNLY